MKTDRSEEIQVLYEVSNAVGEGTDLDTMLAKSLSVLLRKLNCSAGAIYLISEDPAGRCCFQVRKSIPRNLERNPALVEAGRWLPSKMDPKTLSEWWQKLPLSGEPARDAHCHLLSLAPHGVLTMIRSGQGLSGDFLNSLRPITKKLAAAVSACMANAELKATLADLETGRSALKRHKDHLERTVQERTEELRRLNAELTREIEERVHSEQALRQSEERYRKLVNSSPDGIIYHRDGIILFANPAAIRLFGAKSSEELLGTDLYDFVHEDFRDPLIQRRDEAVTTGSVSKPMEARFVRMDGHEISLEVTGTLVPLEEGAVVQTIARDITDRKRAENALKESERRFRLVFHTSPDSINLNRFSDGTFIDINDGFSHLMGYSRDEVIGQTSLSLNIWKNAEDRQRLTEGLAENGYVENLEAQFLRKNGEVGVGLMSARILQINDEAFILSITRDITQRKQVEEALRRSGEQLALAIEGSGAGLWDWKVQTGQLEINERWAEIVGYTLEEINPVSIETWNRLTHPDDLEASNELILEHFSGKRPVYECELRMRHKDGHWVWIMDRGKVVERGEDGSPVRMAGTHVDITERKLVERERKQLEDQLRYSQKMEAIGTLAAGVAHDLNNILSGLVSYPELLLLDLPEESPLRNPILTIKKSGEKAAAIVQDLLTLARRGVATTEPIQLSWIVNDYLKSPEFERLRSFHSNVQVETNLESDLPIITGSPFHLFKTVMNLVSNAVEAMPDGGTVSIETGTAPATPHGRGKEKTPSGQWVYLKVADTGVGIDREDQERIFDPFYTKKVMGRSGTGLGMAVVWGAVEDHRGNIDIESTKGRGTVFTLHFPAGRTPPSMDGALPPPEDYMGHGERIVVVDDIPEQRLIASKMLERLGYTVITMSSGEEAVDYVRRHPVDLFVLDMIMAPGIDGLETYRRILRIQPGQKAIIASGFSETKRVREAQHLGAGAYIKKPYSIEQIGRAVRRELKRPSSSR
ncbi:MAG: PAS domain S-box protein [Desulfobacteraceae bacterium]|nr:PAS domain S-box protein [Desulfobacteraceae bacterium]